MVRRPPRGLRPDEQALWQKVTEKATRLHPAQSTADAQKQSLSKPKTPKTPLSGFRVGQTAKTPAQRHDLAPNIAEHVARQPVAMDRNRFTKMKRGRLAPEARIDLHGMTMAQANPALIRFILDAVADGRRLVLVITGKGKSRSDDGPIPERNGVLRHQVPHWLKSGVLRPHVLQISEAHLKHGGQGAYYVYLRRSR